MTRQLASRNEFNEMLRWKGESHITRTDFLVMVGDLVDIEASLARYYGVPEVIDECPVCRAASGICEATPKAFGERMYQCRCLECGFKQPEFSKSDDAVRFWNETHRKAVP